MLPEDLRRPNLNPTPHYRSLYSPWLGRVWTQKVPMRFYLHSLRNRTTAAVVARVLSCWKVWYVWYIFPNSRYAWCTMEPGSKLCVVSSLSVHSLLRSDFSSVKCISKGITRKSAFHLKQFYLTIWWADWIIIKWSQFEGTLKITEFQTPCQMKINFGRNKISLCSYFEH